MEKLGALGNRLTLCAVRAGGKRALAKASGISEAQFYRYCAEETDIPADRLLAVARAAGVDAGWLLTGEGAMESQSVDLRPAFRPLLLTQINQLFQELLVEYEKPFTVGQRARATTFMYEALRHEEKRRGVTIVPEKFQIFKMMEFFVDLRTESELDVLIWAIDFLEYRHRDQALSHENLQLLNNYCNLITRGYRNYYDGYAGEVYFERIGQQLEVPLVQHLHQLVTQAQHLTGHKELKWLDLGCGNGRSISHLHRTMPEVHVQGVELSNRAVELCHTLVKAERLPVGAVVQGDMREIPHLSNSFDVVTAYYTLHSLPLLENNELGMAAVVREIARVLKPGGVLFVTTFHGHGRNYLLPRQHLTEDDVLKLAALSGLTAEEISVQNVKPRSASHQVDFNKPEEGDLQFTLTKPR